MNLVLTISSIEMLVRTLEGQPREERLKSFSTIMTLLNELKDYAKRQADAGKPIPNVGLYIAEMMEPLRRLAGLEEPPAQGESQDVIGLLSSLKKLRSHHCFNLD